MHSSYENLSVLICSEISHIAAIESQAVLVMK